MAVDATTSSSSSTSSSTATRPKSITQTLGGGTGIDIAGVVDSLVDAQFAARNATLSTRADTLTAQISAAGTHKSHINSFSSALSTLSRSGNLATQPTSSNSGIVNVSRLAGADLTNLNARIEVRQLAAAQTASAAPVSDQTAAIGQGKLTLTFGTATVANGAMSAFTPGSGTPVDITIGAGNSSLAGIASAINAANAGVTASILTDSAGSRLVVKGGSGEARAFTLTATETPGEEGLAALNIGVGASGTTIGSTAADAIVAVDGVAIKRDANTITDLVPGVKLDLVSAQVGTTVNIGKTLPTNALMQAVSDFVDTYNEVFSALRTDLDPVTGSLRQDIAAKALKRQLQALTLTPLASGAAGAPVTLSQLGISTNRDGSITLDSSALSKALVNYPDAVEKMFLPPNGTATSGNGLAAALGGIASAATNTKTGLGASEASYTAAKATVASDQSDAVQKADAMRTRMTRQFASMDARVAAYKATQTFLQGQIDAWNKSN